MRRVLLPLVLLPLAFALVGCTMHRRIGRDAVHYNTSVESMQRKLLLLNIVRAAKRQPMHFTALTQIRGDLTTSGSVSASGPIRRRSGAGATVWSPTVGSEIASNPSFDVAVLDSKEFMTGIMTPVEMDTVNFLFEQGWPRAILLNLFIRRIDVLDNDRLVAKYSNYPVRYTDYKRFRQFLGRPDKWSTRSTTSSEKVGYPVAQSDDPRALRALVEAHEADLELSKEQPVTVEATQVWYQPSDVAPGAWKDVLDVQLRRQHVPLELTKKEKGRHDALFKSEYLQELERRNLRPGSINFVVPAKNGSLQDRDTGQKFNILEETPPNQPLVRGVDVSAGQPVAVIRHDAKDEPVWIRAPAIGTFLPDFDAVARINALRRQPDGGPVSVEGPADHDIGKVTTDTYRIVSSEKSVSFVPDPLSEAALELRRGRKLKYYLRSPRAILYHLGEIARETMKVESGREPFPHVQVRTGPKRVAWPLFMVRPGRGTDSDVRVRFGSDWYHIPPQPDADTGSPDIHGGRSMTCLTLVAHLIALHKSRDDLPTTTTVVTTG